MVFGRLDFVKMSSAQCSAVQQFILVRPVLLRAAEKRARASVILIVRDNTRAQWLVERVFLQYFTLQDEWMKLIMFLKECPNIFVLLLVSDFICPSFGNR